MPGSFFMVANREFSGGRSSPERGELSFWTAADGPLDRLDAWRRETWATFHDAISRAVGLRRWGGDGGPALRRAVLFVHGQEKSWGESALRYGRLCAILRASPATEPCILFAWPSEGIEPDSISGLLLARESAADLADVLAGLVDGLRPGEGAAERSARLSLVAHDLGAYLVQKAVGLVREGGVRASVRNALHRLVLAVPDTDDDLFEPVFGSEPSDGEALARFAERVCVLYSPQDERLARAAALRPSGRPRLGLRGASNPSTLPANVAQWPVGAPSGSSFESARAMSLLVTALQGGDLRDVASPPTSQPRPTS